MRENGHQVWKVAANIFNERVADNQKGVVLQVVGYARCLKLLTAKTYDVSKHFTWPRAWSDTFVLKIGTGGRCLWKWWLNFGFHEMPARNFLPSWRTVSFSRRNLLHGVSYFNDLNRGVKLLVKELFISPFLCVRVFILHVTIGLSLLHINLKELGECRLEAHNVWSQNTLQTESFA
jgi:hypothetical protein